MKKKRFIILSLCVLLLVVGILVAIFRSKQPALYRVTYLPSLGGPSTLPYSINDRGQITGYSEVEIINYHLFLWDREKGIQDLGPVVKGRAFSSMIDNPPYINNTGQIAATMWDTNYKERAFIWDPNHGRCILPTLGGNKAVARGINNHGQVIGEAETASRDLRAFVWDAVNGIRDITPPKRLIPITVSVNDAGHVIVNSISGSRLADVNEGVIPTSPLIPGFGTDINNKGFVVGIWRTGKSAEIGIWHPDSGKPRLLGLNLDWPYTLLNKLLINDVNQVVFSETRQTKFTLSGRTILETTSRNNYRNYLFDPNLGRINLDDYVDIGRKGSFRITDINNNGCIIGIVESTKGSCWYGVLLEPIPEKWNK